MSGAFIAWATSRKNEMGRVNSGILSDYGRKSTLDSAAYRGKVNPDYVQALLQTAPKTSLLIWNSPN